LGRYRRGQCLLIFVLLTLPLSATTYYVDCNGSDSNAGTSTGSAWQTIAKVNSSSFSSGDFVLFKSGCTWREQLIVPSSGRASSPITFGAYGSGTAPIISGADLPTSWTQSGIYHYASVSAQPNQVFSDGSRLTQVSAANQLATGDWWWNGATSAVFVYDNPTGHTIEASQRSYGIFLNGKSYVTVNGLVGDKAQTDGLYNNGAVSGITVTNSTFQHNYEFGARLEQNVAAVVSQVTAFDNGSDGISFQATPSLLIDHCTSHDNSAQTADNHTAGIKGVSTGATNVTIQYSTSYHNGTGQPLSRGAGIWVDTIGGGATIQYNLVYTNNHAGIYVDATSGATVMYNVAYSNGLGAYNGDGIDVNADGVAISGNLVQNNTVYGSQNTGLEMVGDGTPGHFTNNVARNNIVVGTVNGPNFYAHGGGENDGTNGSGNVYTYNAFGAPATNFIEWGSTNYSTYASWESVHCGSTGCSHSLQSDPKLNNPPGGSFTLQAGSPAIDAGANLGSTYQMALDPRTSFPWGTLNQNSQGSGWEIGAFVFVQQTPPAPPTSLSVTVN